MIDKSKTNEAADFVSSTALAKWFMGLVAVTIVFALGWFVAQTRESGNHEARISVLESQYKILSEVVQTQKAHEARLTSVEGQLAKMLTRDEHLVFYAQVIEALREIKTEQLRVRGELEDHDKRMIREHPEIR